MKQEKEQEKAPQEEQRQKAAPSAGEEPQAAASPEKEAASQDREALEKLQKEFDEHKQQYLRVLAEYDNFRKRTAHEKDAIYNNAVSDTVQAILPIADNIERALSQENASAEDMKKGVEMIEAQIKSAFEKLGVTEVGQAGDPFDPNLHNAVMHVEDENAGENTIVEVFQAGFRTEEKVIRFSMVKVAN